MQFQDYLENTKELARIECDILDELFQLLNEEGCVLDKFQIRAARSSLQILIENCIGKARRILKHYNCPVVPTRGRDAVGILFSIGLIEEDLYSALTSAVGFRNAIIHDYMNFDQDILISIVKDQKYVDIVTFLLSDVEMTSVLLKRIENYTI